MMKIKIQSASLLLISLSSFSMDIPVSLEDRVALIGTRIDQEILNTDEKPWFIPAIGCCLNFYTTSFPTIHKPQAITELARIELMGQVNKDIIKELYQEHPYFARLINVMVQDEVEQLNNVTSITLDTLCDTQAKIPQFSREMSSFIHNQAHSSYQKKYLRDYRHYGSFSRKFYSLGEEEIHVMPLKKGNHIPCRLAICDNGKYLKAFNVFDDAVIWDTETGKEVDKMPSDVLITRNKRCKNNNCEKIHDNLMITCGYVDFPYGIQTMYEYYEKHKIVPAMVVIRPTVISWLCQQVFLQNKENAAALTKLRDSEAVGRMQGIPKIMLLRFIGVALAKLERENKQED